MWYANTLLPTMEHVFAHREPPNDAVTCAQILTQEGYHAEGKYVQALSSNDYEKVVWDAHVHAIELERPLAGHEDETVTDEEWEEWYNNK